VAGTGNVDDAAKDDGDSGGSQPWRRWCVAAVATSGLASAVAALQTVGLAVRSRWLLGFDGDAARYRGEANGGGGGTKNHLGGHGRPLAAVQQKRLSRREEAGTRGNSDNNAADGSRRSPDHPPFSLPATAGTPR
jgi:hypothetical protein